MISPTRCARPSFIRSRRATRLGRYPKSRNACSTTARVSATTLSDLLRTRETVAMETFARAATSCRLAMERDLFSDGSTEFDHLGAGSLSMPRGCKRYHDFVN